MADHVLGDDDVVVHLAVVHLELEADEAGQDGGGPRLRADGLDLLAGLGTHDREAVRGYSMWLALPSLSLYLVGGRGRRIGGTLAAIDSWTAHRRERRETEEARNILRDNVRSCLRAGGMLVFFPALSMGYVVAGAGELEGWDDLPFHTDRPFRRHLVGCILSV